MGWNAAQFNEVASKNGEHWNRQTYYEHRKHALTAEQRVVQAAVQVRQSGALKIRDIEKHDNTTVLEAIRDLGMKRALENPEDVTVDQGLKAASILEQRKDRGGSGLQLLVAFVTGTDRPAVVIEGSAQEISQ